MDSPAFLVTTRLPAPGMDILEAAGTVILPSAPLSARELARACASGRYDVLVAQLGDVLDAGLLGEARLKGISNYAVGYNNIDVAEASRRSIMVANTPDVLTDATADIALLLMLGTARRVVESDHFMRSGQYTGWRPELLLGSDVSGRTLGLAGFGRIARATARRALGFGMEVLFSPRPPEDREVTAEELGEFAGKVRQVPWEELVASSDFLSVHVPLTEATRHLVDADVLRAMKSTAILINTARGPIVDEQALVNALKEGDIAGAGLDVYEDEPLMAAGLSELPNTVLLPHVGSATVAVRSEMARLCAENAVAMARGDRPAHLVNP
jgi:glyoxylate reductase